MIEKMLETPGWDSWFDGNFIPYKDMNLEPARIIVEYMVKNYHKMTE